MNTSISVLVPCFNESGNVEATFLRIANSLKNVLFEVIFINDGSSDPTEQEIRKLLGLNPGLVQLVTHPVNKGIPQAWKSGLAQAKYDLICLIDGDLQNPPEAIPNLIQVYYESQSDVVQGVRSTIGRTKNERLFFSRGLNSILNFIFNQTAKDSKSGFLLSTKEALEDVFTDLAKFRYFQTFIGVSFRSKGYRVFETETLFVSREVGNSFLTSSKTREVVFSTLRDLFVGLKLYGRKNNSAQYLPGRITFKIELSFIRKIWFHLFFATTPLHKWIIGKRAKSFYYWLKSTEFMSRAELDSLQLRRAQKLLQHAYLTVPYYKRVFDESGFKPNEMKKLSDLSKVPILSKTDVRENVHFSLFSTHHNKKEMHRISTSGSTGEPFVCYADKFQLEMRFATTLRALEMSGWRFGDRQLRLWHQTLGMSRVQALKEKIDAFFMRRHFIPAFELSEDSLAHLMRVIDRKKPVLIDGYAESLNFIALASAKKSSHKPKVVVSSAQQLTDSTRERIEEQFGSRVIDKYGSREFSGIAYQCLLSAHHHVQDESYILEILVDGRPALPGETGEIVITDLNNFSMPLIRYRIGDLSVAVNQNTCECGRSHYMIGDITGRTQALIACVNGVWLPGTFFAHFFKDFDFAIQHYQVFQEAFGEFKVLIVPKSQFTKQVELNIIDNLKNYTGVGQKITIVRVLKIPLLKTGKRTPVISNLKIDFQKIAANSIWKNS